MSNARILAKLENFQPIIDKKYLKYNYISQLTNFSNNYGKVDYIVHIVNIFNFKVASLKYFEL